MGNHCANARDKASEYKDSATVKLDKAKKATKDGYEVTKMRAQGFKVQKIEDTSQMACVTEFQ